MNRHTSLFIALASLFLIFFLFTLSNQAQDNESKIKLSSDAKLAREQTLRMADEMKEILEEYYYDPKFHGIDLKARIETAKTRIKTLQYNWQMYRVLVQLLMDFNDSHTRMYLPPRTDYFQYGFGMQMIADECFTVSIEKDSDASRQGMEVGDQIISIGKFKPTRRDLWKINYVIYKLDPADTLDLQIRKPDGTVKTLTIKAKKMTEKEYRAEQKKRKDKSKFEPYKCQEINKETIACKLYSFVIEKNDIDKMMKKVSAYPKFILDLRGNSGGYVIVEQYLLSYFFDKEIKIADLVLKDKTESRFTKPLGDKQYKGEVAVLIDSNSASAAEITARVLQLEKRAKVYGDMSSGSVMTSIGVPFRSIVSALSYVSIIQVGMSVTVADVIMRDGSRLENNGVIPDEILQPSGLALAKKTDPVLAYTAIKFGAEITPEQAGNYYFMTKKVEDEDNDEN